MFSISRTFSKSLNQNPIYYSPRYVFNPEHIQRVIEQFSQKQLMLRRLVKFNNEAAVLIPVCEVDGEVSVLYTLRGVGLRSHRGQVSFPGGKKDACDKSIEDTAIRETEEELGIDSDRIEVWGRGQSIVTMYKTSVVPVIGRIKGNLQVDSLNFNRDEVEEVFSVPLSHLCDPKKSGYTQFRVLVSGAPFSAPVYLGGKHRIWGLTGYLTHKFLQCLLPPEAYVHRVKFVPPVVFTQPIVE